MAVICDVCGDRGWVHEITSEKERCPACSVPSGTLGVPLRLRREPTSADFADPRFNVLWQLMKQVDVGYRNGTFSGATGNDVCAVLDALDIVSGQTLESAPKADAVDPQADASSDCPRA